MDYFFYNLSHDINIQYNLARKDMYKCLRLPFDKVKIDRMCDEVWYVYAPLATRSSRLIRMRGYSTEKTEMFLKNQQSEEEFLRRSDRTVPNGEDVTESDMIKIISAYLNC